MDKTAYPQGEFGIQVRAPHDIQKWMQAMQTIYAQTPVLGWESAFKTVTANWGVMEQLDFKNWLKFYEESSHQKYKVAQFMAPTKYLDNGGGIVPIDSLKASLPIRAPDMGAYVAQQHEADKARQDQELKHEMIQKKIKALIGRLNAAEKVATLPEIQSALKNTLRIPLDQWLSTLQNLKLQVQMAAPSIRVATTVGDLIYKHANILVSQGDRKAAIVLLKIAQGLPTETMGGGPQMNPATSPMPQQPVAAADPKDDPAVSEFLKLLSGDQGDINDVDEDEEEDDQFAAITVDDTDRVVTAQAAPGMAGPPAPANPGADLEVSEEEIAPRRAPAPAPIASPHNDPFDLALGNVKMPDLIARLEAIANMFKNRELARQLSIVDLVMDKLGIAPFFPTLAEAMRSALESNQYCQSRIEEILAKLRGTVETPMSNRLEDEIGTDNLELEMIKRNLAKDEAAEKERKERRKAQQLADEEAALAPAPEEALAGPATVQQGPAAPVRPMAG